MNNRRLEAYLQQINDRANDSQADATDAPSTDDTALAGIIQALADPSRVAPESMPDDQSHYCLDALQNVVAQRLENELAFELPEHLSTCPLCLEAFTILLDQAQSAVPPGDDRFVNDLTRRILPARTDASPLAFTPPRHWRRWAALAATIVFCLLSTALFYRPAVPITVQNGTLLVDSAAPADRSFTLTGRPTLRTPKPAVLQLPDGSQLKTQAQTRFSITKSLLGHTTVDLKQGQVTAAVAKQVDGKTFIVKTPLGKITVIGTRFTVDCRQEHVDIFETDNQDQTIARPNQSIDVVEVTVHEGVVMVENKHEKVKVRAGHSALIRFDQPRIEVDRNDL